MTEETIILRIPSFSQTSSSITEIISNQSNDRVIIAITATENKSFIHEMLKKITTKILIPNRNTKALPANYTNLYDIILFSYNNFNSKMNTLNITYNDIHSFLYFQWIYKYETNENEAQKLMNTFVDSYNIKKYIVLLTDNGINELLKQMDYINSMGNMIEYFQESEPEKILNKISNDTYKANVKYAKMVKKQQIIDTIKSKEIVFQDLIHCVSVDHECDAIYNEAMRAIYDETEKDDFLLDVNDFTMDIIGTLIRFTKGSDITLKLNALNILNVITDNEQLLTIISRSDLMDTISDGIKIDESSKDKHDVSNMCMFLMVKMLQFNPQIMAGRQQIIKDILERTDLSEPRIDIRIISQLIVNILHCGFLNDSQLKDILDILSILFNYDDETVLTSTLNAFNLLFHDYILSERSDIDFLRIYGDTKKIKKKVSSKHCSSISNKTVFGYIHEFENKFNLSIPIVLNKCIELKYDIFTFDKVVRIIYLLKEQDNLTIIGLLLQILINLIDDIVINPNRYNTNIMNVIDTLIKHNIFTSFEKIKSRSDQDPFINRGIFYVISGLVQYGNTSQIKDILNSKENIDTFWYFYDIELSMNREDNFDQMVIQETVTKIESKIENNPYLNEKLNEFKNKM